MEVFDLGDGAYTVHYKIIEIGQYALSVVTNDDSANAKTDTITVVPNISDPASSQITFNGLIEVDSEETVLTHIYDEFGNEVTDTESLLLHV